MIIRSCSSVKTVMKCTIAIIRSNEPFRLTWGSSFVVLNELPVKMYVNRFPLSFRDKLNQKGPTNTCNKIQNLNFFIFHPILMQYFAKLSSYFMGNWWAIKNSYLISKGVLQGPNSKLLHIFRYIIKWETYLKYSGPTNYCF